MILCDETVLRLSDGVKGREEKFGLLIISRTTPALCLNTDGKFVFNMIDGQRSIAEIIGATNEEYEGDAREKVYELLQSFVDLQLCELVS